MSVNRNTVGLLSTAALKYSLRMSKCEQGQIGEVQERERKRKGGRGGRRENSGSCVWVQSLVNLVVASVS